VIAVVAGVVVVTAIAAVKADVLSPMPAKIVLGSALPFFYGSSLAAIGHGNGRRRHRDHETLEADENAQDDSLDEDEPGLVYSWTKERLVSAGVSEPSAELLSIDHRFSVHELEQLLDAGCPLETALRILEPI
jgi:hypothetical protein